MENAHRNDRTNIQNIYSCLPRLKNERLISNIELTFHKALIRSIKTYTCPPWEFAADTYILKWRACKIRFSA